MDVTLTEQLKLVFKNIESKEKAFQVFKITSEQYSEACSFISEFYFNNNFKDSISSLHDSLYQVIRFQYGLKSQMTESAFKTVIARYKTISEQQKQKVSKYTDESGRHYTFRHDLHWLQKPIIFKRPQVNLVRGRDWSFKNGMKTISVNTLFERVNCSYQCKPDSRIFDPTWKHGTAKLVFHESDKNWYLHISVTRAFPETNRTKIKEVCGHDRGLVNIITTCHDDGSISYTNGADVAKIRKKYANTRASLQSKGTKGAKRVLKRISGRENRMMNDVDHCISKTLASTCSTDTLHIFEDLTGISFDKNLKNRNSNSKNELRSWSFYSLETKAIYKTAMRRGMILKVNPQYTSQRCPKCGNIDKTARNHEKHTYTCPKCGSIYNDDAVASMNLKQLGLWYLSGVNDPHFSTK